MVHLEAFLGIFSKFKVGINNFKFPRHVSLSIVYYVYMVNVTVLYFLF